MHVCCFGKSHLILSLQINHLLTCAGYTGRGSNIVIVREMSISVFMLESYVLMTLVKGIFYRLYIKVET